MDQNNLIVIVKVFRAYIHLLLVLANFANWLVEYEQRQHERRNLRQRTFTRFQVRAIEIQRITRESDIICVNELRMDRNAFAILCELLKTRGGLLDDGNVTIVEQVATFVKDRATGSLAESAADAMENINLENEVGADTEDFNVPLSTPSNGASASPVTQEGEASSKKRKRKATAADNMFKLIEKGLNSVSEEMGKLVSVVGTPGLGTMPAELKKMGFDHRQCITIGMYFADNPIQLRLWNDMDEEFKPSFVESVLEKLNM